VQLTAQPSCKQSLEITVPVSEVEEETERVVASLAERVRLPGFRPGKVPTSLIRVKFADDIREQVIDNLVPRFFQKRVEEEHLRVVGRPDVTEVHFQPGEPLTFRAEFEVAPEIELSEYIGLTVPYQEPVVTELEVADRLEELRQHKAEFVNEDPRPVVDGDFAVISLEAIGGQIQSLRKQEELVVHVGGEETLEAFSAPLRALAPGEEREFDVTYPEDYGDEKLAGKTVRFRAVLKGIRRKELPELNDEFARDLGDFQTLEELREEVRKSLLREKEVAAQQEAKDKLVAKLLDLHDFPVPEAYVERQIEARVEEFLQAASARGVDPQSIKLDWQKVRESQREKAVRDVKASMLLAKIAERESIGVTQEEVEREVQRIARQRREPVGAVRNRLKKEGLLHRIALQIRTEKTLNFLFDHARKESAG